MRGRSFVLASGEAGSVIPRSEASTVIPRSEATRNPPSSEGVEENGSLASASAEASADGSLGMTGRAAALGMKWVRIALGTTALLALSACQERGRPDPNIRMAISHEREEASGNATPAVPNRLEVPPEVAKAYSGVRIHWKDGSNGKEGTLEVPLEGTARIPSSDLEIRADVFLPAFTMTQQTITSEGTDPANPAARIAVLEKGQEIFGGWIFTRFPDVHPFQHPRFSLRLEGGTPRKGTKT